MFVKQLPYDPKYLDTAWIDGGLAILRSFQQYFSHIRMMGGPFMIEKIPASSEA